MATTRAVLRDAATMVRRLGQRVRTASAHGRNRSCSAPSDQLQADAAARAAGRRANAGARAGRRHARPRQSPEPLRTTHRDDSQGQDREAERVRQLVTIQESEHQIITAYEVHATRPADVTLWTAGVGSASGHLRPRAGSGRRRSRLQLGDRTNRRRLTAACDAWSCRGAARSRRRDAPMNINAGSVAANGGASAAKAASVCSNVDMDCAAVATMASTACIAGSASASSRTI